jgi:hypothetical protein
MKLSCLLLFFLLGLPSVCLADLENENLLQPLPSGYKVDFQTKQGNMIMTEMVPQAETVDSWSEMITTQIFLGMKSTTPEQFQEGMAKRWLAACRGGEVATITKGVENGYAFSIWLQTCSKNPSTGKPENTWFKAIKGNDSFYLVQKAYRFDPSKDQITHWMQYFRSVTVCDTRLADRQCR